MDAKKLLEYGLLAVLAYFAITWLFRVATSVGDGLASTFAPVPTPDYPPTVFAPGFIYWSTDLYGGTPVRWQAPRRGGYTGRPRNAGGY